MPAHQVPAPFPTRGRLAGVDFGTVRIGIAVSDPLRRIASPFENYSRKGLQADTDYFRRLVAREEIVGFVVGLPVHASGDESEKSRQARRFGAWLQEVTGCPVQYFDERFSTSHAHQLLAEGHFTKKRARQRLDKVAAQVILTSYLEASARGSDDRPGALDDERS